MLSSRQKLAIAVCIAVIISGIIIFAQVADTESKKITTKNWDPKKPVTEKDFKGKVPDGATASAYLHWILKTDWDFQVTIEDDECVAKPIFSVTAQMNTTKSWAKPPPSKELLNHEQGHLDIAEYQARLLENKLNKEFGKEMPCPPEFDEATMKKITEMVDKAQEDTKKMQDQYDDEVKPHGRIDPTKQKEWNKKIADFLKNTPRN